MHPQQKEYIYKKTGNTKPVFLDQNTAKSRVYIDTQQGDITLLYSVDPAENILNKPAQVEWVSYEGGRIQADFATELFGPPTAVRLYIKNTGNSSVKLTIVQ